MLTAALWRSSWGEQAGGEGASAFLDRPVRLLVHAGSGDSGTALIIIFTEHVWAAATPSWNRFTFMRLQAEHQFRPDTHVTSV